MKNPGKKFIYLCLSLLILVLAFYLWIQFRTGHDYKDHFAKLLPPDTAAFASLSDLEGLWNRITSLKVYQEITESEELAYLLLSSEDIQKWKNNLSQIEYKTRMDLGKNFILRWLGQDVAIALVPPESLTAPPGILVMSKTRIGFEEKLAEFIALYYPDLDLKTESYKRVSIHQYKGKKKFRSFSYLRFGRTVILSLRSSDISLLRKIVDLKKDKDPPSLYTSEYFKQYLASLKPNAGISLFINKDNMLNFLKASQKYSKSRTLEDMLPRISEILNPYAHIHLRIHLEKGLEGEMGFYYQNPAEQMPPPPAEFQSLAKLPDNTSLFLGMKDSNLSSSLKTILTFFFNNKNTEKSKDTELSELKRLLHEYILSHLKNEFTVSLVKMEPGIVTPLFSGDIFLEVKEPPKAEQEMITIFESLGAKKENREQGILTPIGTLGYSLEGDFVRIKLRAQPDASQDLKPESNLSANPLFQNLFPSGMRESHVVLYLNFQRISEDLDKLAKGSIQWNEKTRERVKQFKKWAGVCRYLQACAVWDKRDDKTIVYNIRIPLQ